MICQHPNGPWEKTVPSPILIPIPHLPARGVGLTLGCGLIEYSNGWGLGRGLSTTHFQALFWKNQTCQVVEVPDGSGRTPPTHTQKFRGMTPWSSGGVSSGGPPGCGQLAQFCMYNIVELVVCPWEGWPGGSGAVCAGSAGAARRQPMAWSWPAALGLGPWEPAASPAAHPPPT